MTAPFFFVAPDRGRHARLRPSVMPGCDHSLCPAATGYLSFRYGLMAGDDITGYQTDSHYLPA